MKLRCTRRFRDELLSQHTFLHERNPKAAELALERINRATERLKTFPHLGQPWRLEATWELVAAGTPYILVYRIKEDAIEALALFHVGQEAPGA